MQDDVAVVGQFRPDIDFGHDPLPNLPELLDEIKRAGKSVARVRYREGDAWIVVGYENITGVFRNDAEIPAGPHYQEEMSAIGRTIETMEGAEQRAYKTTMNRWFTAKNVKSFEDSVILPVIDGLIDDFGDRRALPLNDVFSRRFGFNVISRLVGIDVPPEAEAEVQEMVHGMIQMLDPHAPLEVRRQKAREAAARADDMFRPVVEQRRAQPRDDFISYLVSAQVDGRPLTEAEILDHTKLIYLAGTDSTGMMLDNAMAAILSRPDLLERVRSDPSARQPIVDELIRLESASGLVVRRAVKETTICDVMIPEGGFILLGVPNANRDPERFPSPEEVKVGRKHPDLSLTFGMGPHLCLGKHLARLEIQLAVGRLLDRLPGLRLDGPVVRPTGSQFRFIAEGLRVRFDGILPPP